MIVVYITDLIESCSCCNLYLCIAFASVVLLVICVVVYLLVSKFILYRHEKFIIKHTFKANNRQSYVSKDGKIEYCPFTAKKQ